MDACQGNPITAEADAVHARQIEAFEACIKGRSTTQQHVVEEMTAVTFSNISVCMFIHVRQELPPHAVLITLLPQLQTEKRRDANPSRPPFNLQKKAPSSASKAKLSKAFNSLRAWIFTA